MDTFLARNPFPREFDCARIEKWFRFGKLCQVPFKNIGAIVRDAGHTDPIHLQHIHVLLVAMGLPPPPSPFFSATSSRPGRVRIGNPAYPIAKPFNGHTPTVLVILELVLGILLSDG